MFKELWRRRCLKDLIEAYSEETGLYQPLDCNPRKMEGIEQVI
jgi:hypothetical protein